MANQSKQIHRDYPLEVKEITEEGRFSGYASVFDVIDYYDDEIVRGAFTKSIAEKMPVMLWQHKQRRAYRSIRKHTRRRHRAMDRG